MNGFTYQVKSVRGIAKAAEKVKAHLGLTVGCALFVLLLTVMHGYVLDVRVTGLESENGQILTDLESAGLTLGSPWRKVDTEQIENTVLMTSDTVSWLNIERVGSVAYVTVKEKEPVEPQSEKELKKGNIVSKCEGIVEEITVKEGLPTVKVGQTVKTGDLLVSGILSDGSSVIAQANVRIRTVGETRVEVPRTAETVVTNGKKMISFRLKILNFFVNLNKRYGNLPTECAIIEDNKSLTFRNGVRFPISVFRKYAVCSETQSFDLADDALVESARTALHEKFLSEIGDADLNSVSVDFSLSEDGCVGTIRYEAVVKGGTFVPFSGETHE
ncbi:MAG: sporulation protein YqfD [Clostridia bacterium]|nr:sporulation protein YqfD [Clostridia bacterium]